MTLHSTDETNKRRYNSPRRQQQALETRTAILDAALGLFVSHGFNATTMRQVANSAGVSEQTVYNTFGDKAELLWRVAMRSVTGTPMGEDPADTAYLDDLKSEVDPIKRIRMHARNSRDFWEKGLLEIELMVFGTKHADSKLEDLAERLLDHKHKDVLATAAVLFPDEVRRPGISLEEIAAIWTAVDAAHTAKTLFDLGWTLDDWEQWLGDLFITQFVDPNLDREPPAVTEPTKR